MSLTEKEYRLIKSKLLDKCIFKGLTNLNNGFDVSTIKYFSEIEFQIVLNRIEQYGFGIHGIEPWLNGALHRVILPDDFNFDSKHSNWYQEAFKMFIKEDLPLVYAATYDIPKEIMNNFYTSGYDEKTLRFSQ